MKPKAAGKERREFLSGMGAFTMVALIPRERMAGKQVSTPDPFVQCCRSCSLGKQNCTLSVMLSWTWESRKACNSFVRIREHIRTDPDRFGYFHEICCPQNIPIPECLSRAVTRLYRVDSAGWYALTMEGSGIGDEVMGEKHKKCPAIG